MTTSFGDNLSYINSNKLDSTSNLKIDVSEDGTTIATASFTTSSASNFITVGTVSLTPTPTLVKKGSFISTNVAGAPSGAGYIQFDTTSAGAGKSSNANSYDAVALSTDGKYIFTCSILHSSPARKATISIFEYDTVGVPGDWDRIGFYTQADDFPTITATGWSGIRVSPDNTKLYLAVIQSAGAFNPGFIKFNLNISTGGLTLDGSPVYVGVSTANLMKQYDLVMSNNKKYYINAVDGDKIIVYDNVSGDTWTPRPTITLAGVQTDSGQPTLEQLVNANAITNDGSTLVIGVTADNFSLNPSSIEGFVHYTWTGSAWSYVSFKNILDDIDPDSVNLDNLSQLTISDDGTRLCVGDGFFTGDSTSLSKDYIYYQYNGSIWQPKGDLNSLSSGNPSSYTIKPDKSFSYFIIPISGGIGDPHIILASREAPVAANDNFPTALPNNVNNVLNIINDNGSGVDNLKNHYNLSLVITGASSVPSGIISGSGAPGPGDGSDGQYYVDTDTSDIYGPKASGTWPGSPISAIADPVAGTITAVSGLPVGDYTITYKWVSDSGLESNVATLTFELYDGAAGPIVANDDLDLDVARTGSPATIDVLANDILSGRNPITEITVVFDTPPAVPSGFTVNASNQVEVASTVNVGNYTFNYDILDGLNSNNPTGNPATVTLHYSDATLPTITGADINIGPFYTEDFPDTFDLSSALTTLTGYTDLDDFDFVFDTPPAGVSYAHSTKLISFTTLPAGDYSISYILTVKNNDPYTTITGFDVIFKVYDPIVLANVGPITAYTNVSTPIDVLSTSNLGGRLPGDVTVVYKTGTGNPTFLVGNTYTVPPGETIGSYSFEYQVTDNTKVGTPETTQAPAPVVSYDVAAPLATPPTTSGPYTVDAIVNASITNGAPYILTGEDILQNVDFNTMLATDITAVVLVGIVPGTSNMIASTVDPSPDSFQRNLVLSTSGNVDIDQAGVFTIEFDVQTTYGNVTQYVNLTVSDGLTGIPPSLIGTEVQYSQVFTSTDPLSGGVPAASLTLDQAYLATRINANGYIFISSVIDSVYKAYLNTGTPNIESVTLLSEVTLDTSVSPGFSNSIDLTNIQYGGHIVAITSTYTNGLISPTITVYVSFKIALNTTDPQNGTPVNIATGGASGTTIQPSDLTFDFLLSNPTLMREYLLEMYQGDPYYATLSAIDQARVILSTPNIASILSKVIDRTGLMVSYNIGSGASLTFTV